MVELSQTARALLYQRPLPGYQRELTGKYKFPEVYLGQTTRVVRWKLCMSEGYVLFLRLKVSREVSSRHFPRAWPNAIFIQ